MAIAPIWKDYFAKGGREDSCQFCILADDAGVYFGKAYRRPDNLDILIRINDICADYLFNEFPDIRKQFNAAPLRTFQLCVLEDGEYQLYDDVEFYNDWSYDYDFNPNYRGLNCPVNGRFVLETPLPFSVLNASELEMDVNNGVAIGYVDPSSNGAGTYMLDFTQIDFNGSYHLQHGDDLGLSDMGLEEYQHYTCVDFCARYALYYRNAYGGIDMLLMEGNHSESDSLVRHTREVEHDNSNISNRSKSNYVNEISKSMTLYTSWLSDAESLRMHHLLNSTEVYLFDIVEQKMIPVLMTNTTTEYKTYRGNGGKLVNYAIQVTLANDRIRR